MAVPDLRPMKPEDRFEVAELIYLSINHWHQTHGRSAGFQGGPRTTEVFYDVYQAMTPDKNVVAVHPETGRIMGSCFYHPREHHVSLGIMTVHPNYFGCGVGSLLVKHIVDYTEEHDYRALRLASSAINLDSFSLYNRAGFVPRCFLQDMIVPVPETGLSGTVPGLDCVRPATEADIPAMAHLEMDVSGITREIDYRYCIENKDGFWNVTVFENARGDVDGFLIAGHHPAMRLLGPCVARSAGEALAMIYEGLNQYKGGAPVVLIPSEEYTMVQQLYDWGARNCELHVFQVRGEFKPFNGISMPTFLPESG